jgi:hypothetical protein
MLEHIAVQKAQTVIYTDSADMADMENPFGFEQVELQ